MSVGGSADRSPLQDGSGNKTAGGSSSLKKTVAGTPAPMTGRTVEGMTIFHEPWWLAAVSGGAAERVEIADKDGRVVGFLPYVVKSIYGVKVSNMAPFTHVLGPVVELGGGSPITRMHNRFKMTSELLEKLPSLAIFRQALDCTVPDALALQD